LAETEEPTTSGLLSELQEERGMNTDKRTDDELNRIIAEWMGFKVSVDLGLGLVCGARVLFPAKIPNYCGSLDAIDEAERKTTDAQFQEYYELLYRRACASTPHDDNVKYKRMWISATARQRAEALVKVIEKGKK
jgi:reverse gyrase